MNPDIKRCAKRKRRTFKLEGRGPNYRKLQKEMDRLVGIAKRSFFDDVKKEVIEKKNTRNYHKTVKKFSCREAAPPWDVRVMLPGKSDEERCEEVASYFNQI